MYLNYNIVYVKVSLCHARVPTVLFFVCGLPLFPCVLRAERFFVAFRLAIVTTTFRFRFLTEGYWLNRIRVCSLHVFRSRIPLAVQAS